MADNPLINGHKYGWASIEAFIGGDIARDFTEISYSSKLEPGKVRGFGMRTIGRTRGEGEHEGSITMLKSEAQKFIATLGKGFMLRDFVLTVAYGEDAEGTVSDNLVGCRIKSVEDNPKQGNEPVTVKFDLDVMRIYYDSIDPFEDKP